MNTFNIPRTIIAGDRVIWYDESLSGIDPTGTETISYNPVTHLLTYFLRGNSQLDVTGTEENGKWKSEISTVASSLLIAGKYRVQICIFSGFDRVTLGEFAIEIKLSLSEINTAIDGRPLDEIELAAVEGAIADVLKDGVSEYEIKGRRVIYHDLDKLKALRTELRARIARQKGGDKTSNIHIKFN